MILPAFRTHTLSLSLCYSIEIHILQAHRKKDNGIFHEFRVEFLKNDFTKKKKKKEKRKKSKNGECYGKLRKSLFALVAEMAVI